MKSKRHKMNAPRQTRQKRLASPALAKSPAAAELSRVIAERDAALAELASLRAAPGVSAKPENKPETKNDEYAALLQRIHKIARRKFSSKSQVLVVSKGDPKLLEAVGKSARHFPADERGVFCGYHPACSLSATARLETDRAAGAEYLVLPETSFWWLSTYNGLQLHLEDNYELVVDDPSTCKVYALRSSSKRAARGNLVSGFRRLVLEFRNRYGRDPVVLNLDEHLDLALMFPELKVFSGGAGKRLPFMDGSVDIVVVNRSEPARIAEARRVAGAAVVVPKGNGSVKVSWQPGAPTVHLPRVSIIIPVYNGQAMTDECLRSLLRVLPAGYQGEIIVVDDASTDGTACSLKAWARRDQRIKVIRNPKNLGFVGTCNRGAAAADGEILVFLNNDLILLLGWLSPLLKVFRRFPDAGVVGGKLVLPDGTLQEAGGRVFRDGSALNFGRPDANPEAPLYNFIREVDYCSGALFATPRALFEKLGGFDPAFRPGYYEDTDYCFKVRAAGLKVYYQPASAVIHREGGTAGTDLKVGMKRYQVVNQTKFIKRWKAALEGQPVRPAVINAHALQALAVREAWTGKKRKALVCALMPEFDRDSGSRRIYDLLVFLQEEGWDVTFVSEHEKYSPLYAQHLQQRGIAVYGGSGVWVKELISAGGFDLAIFGLWHIAEPHLSMIRVLSPRTRVIVDSIDLHFLRLARGTFLNRAEDGSQKLLDTDYASGMMRELNTYAAADAVLTVSQKEADLINDLVADAALAQPMPDNEDLPLSPVPMEDRRGLVFIGCYRHVPNVGAVKFLCEEILPKIPPKLLKRHPVSLIGDGMTDEVRSFGKGLTNVKMVGWVPKVEPYLEHARLSVIPLRFGAGTKRKMLQTLMTGTPAVSTSIGVEGLRLQDEEHVLVADDAAGFARAITRLLEDDGLWSKLARNGRRHIASLHGPELARQSLREVIKRVMANQPKTTLLEKTSAKIKAGRMGQLEYLQMIGKITSAVRDTLPAGATVAVASKGDSALLDLDGRTGWHFPRGEGGVYAGYYPADGDAAVAHLQTLQAQGAAYFLLPATACWWLEHYPELRAYLETDAQLVFDQEDICKMFKLNPVIVQTVDIPARRRKSAANLADVKLIAFYLPQFHPIPENDAWWGRGFTEWTNVTKAQPQFSGHHQPRLPADLGYYDLRMAEVRQAQADLAREYGVHGFCYYHYWFGGKRLLEQPFNVVLNSREPDFPFCLCWANEPWSRRWNGRPEEVLQAQEYSAKDDLAHIRWLLPALKDKRAIRIAGKPVFLVYQGRDLPDPAATINLWQREVKRAGLPGIYLMSVETGWDAGWDATEVGFDAKVLFMPQFSMLFNSGADIKVDGKEKLRVYDYQKAWPKLARPEPVKYQRYETVCPGWDNSARRGGEAVVLHNSTPEAYENWLRQAVERASKMPPGKRVVFLNAWNEWAEGAHLEPDAKNGRAYLEATARALMK